MMYVQGTFSTSARNLLQLNFEMCLSAAKFAVFHIYFCQEGQINEGI